MSPKMKKLKYVTYCNIYVRLMMTLECCISLKVNSEYLCMFLTVGGNQFTWFPKVGHETGMVHPRGVFSDSSKCK